MQIPSISPPSFKVKARIFTLAYKALHDLAFHCFLDFIFGSSCLIHSAPGTMPLCISFSMMGIFPNAGFYMCCSLCPNYFPSPFSHCLLSYFLLGFVQMSPSKRLFLWLSHLKLRLIFNPGSPLVLHFSP